MRKNALIATAFVLIGSLAPISVAGASSLPKVLTSSSAKLSASKADATTKTVPVQPQPAPDEVVTVQQGDTLIAIADAHQTTYQRLFDANDSVADPNVIHVGQEFRVPKDSEQLPDRIGALPQATQQSAAAAASAYTSARSAPASYAAITGNDAKAFIYNRESGNNPNATNPNGCYGLGQDCNGRVKAQCGADYACQDAYFTSYATSRYGSWDNAAAFWQANGWW